jgi:phage repressor protein C with HTH and peptisase S24 domain
MKKTKALRIKEFSDYKGISLRSIEKKAGYTLGIVSAAINRNGDITEDLSKILDAYPEINPKWLFEGKGQMLVNTDNTTSISTDKIILNEDQEKYGEENETFFSISKNKTFYVPVSKVPDFINSSPSLTMLNKFQQLTLPPDFDGVVNYVFQVAGSHMYPTFSNGDNLGCIYQENKKYIEFGDPYLIDIGNGSLLFRRLIQSEDPNIIILRSDNIAYQDIRVEKEDLLHLFRVTTKLSKDVSERYLEKQLMTMFTTIEQLSNKILDKAS